MLNRDIFIKILFVVTSVVIFCCLYFYPYFYSSYKVLIGFDTGLYIDTINQYRYLSILELGSIVDSFLEPGYFLFTKILGILYPTTSTNLYLISSVIIALLNALMLYFLISKITRNSFWAMVSACLFLFSPVQLNAYYQSYLKQLFASFFLLLCFYTFFSLKDNLKIIVNRSLSEVDSRIKRLALMKFAVYTISSALVFIAHKGVFLIWAIFTLVSILYLLFYLKIDFKKVFITYLLHGVIVILLCLPYLWFTYEEYWKIAYDTAYFALFAKEEAEAAGVNVGGSSVLRYIKTANLYSTTTNPIFVYLMSFIPLTYLCFVKLKNRYYNDNFLILFGTFLISSIWVFLGITFANRFIINIDILMYIMLGFSLSSIEYTSIGNAKNKYLLVLILIFTLNIFLSTYSSVNRRPYIYRDLEGIETLQSEVPQRDSIIFAPDYIQVSLQQFGYQAAVYSDITSEQSKEKKITPVDYTSEVLINSCNNTALMDAYLDEGLNPYIVIGKWNVDNPLYVSSLEGYQYFPHICYDNSNLYERVYEGQNELFRIYKLKNF